MGQVSGYELFYELFLGPEPWGFFGPLGLVIFGYVLAKKDKALALIWFIVEWLFIANYLTLVSATPDYWWHIIIILFGGLFTLVYPLWDR